MPPVNRLLAALPEEVYRTLSPELKPVPLESGQVVLAHREPIREVYFPARSAWSIISTAREGAGAEIASIGREGLVGIGALLGATEAMFDWQVQMAGDGVAYAMDIAAFRRELDRRGAFFEVMASFSQRFVKGLMQSVACNGLHSAEARCCRWLLLAQDHLEQPDFPLTHDRLAAVLGVRRPTVTLVIRELVQSGVLSTRRGHVIVLDRPALEARSCECYRTSSLLLDHRPLPSDDQVKWSFPHPTADGVMLRPTADRRQRDRDLSYSR